MAVRPGEVLDIRLWDVRSVRNLLTKGGLVVGFSRKMRRKRESDFLGVLAADEHFGAAMRFDEGAVDMLAGEGHFCRRDGRPLTIVRSVSVTKWKGRQDQMECPGCSTRYVQFVPEK